MFTIINTNLSSENEKKKRNERRSNVLHVEKKHFHSGENKLEMLTKKKPPIVSKMMFILTYKITRKEKKLTKLLV